MLEEEEVVSGGKSLGKQHVDAGMSKRRKFFCFFIVCLSIKLYGESFCSAYSRRSSKLNVVFMCENEKDVRCLRMKAHFSRHID